MMNKAIQHNRFLVLRRILQIALIILFAGGNLFGWTFIRGNLSSASLLDTIPLSDPFATLQILVAGSAIAVDLILGAGIVLILYGLIFGRVFCSWICPVNIIVDTANWVKAKLKSAYLRIPFTRNLRYYWMGLSIILSFILGYGAYELISPVSLLYRGLIFGIGIGWGLIIALFILEAISVNALWCSRLCPLGAFYSIIGGLRLLRVNHSHEKCSKCNLCFEVCPEVQVLKRVGKSSGTINGGSCTNCARCIEVCDDDALNFTFTGKRNNL